jgi:hypothetical protein
VLPAAITTIERCFTAMKIVKPHLRNHIGDEHMSNNLICYVEKGEMMKVNNEAMVCCFMKLKEYRFDIED